jgi:hypothetical protein
VPVAIRNLGPWTGGPEGEVDRLRLPYRLLLGKQGFVLIYQHVSKLKLESSGAHALHPGNRECHQAKAASR